jgi:diguanylate cyclase (GGDEF)-like protein
MACIERERRARETASQLREAATAELAGNLGLTVVYLLLSRNDLSTRFWIGWGAVSVAVCLVTLMFMLGRGPTSRTDRGGLPLSVRGVHVLTGLVWGSLFLMPTVTRQAGDPPLLELCVSFALTAGAVGGAGFSRLGRDVIMPMWVLAIIGSLWAGDVAIAGGVAVFLAVIIRNMKFSERQYEELRELRQHAVATAATAVYNAERDGLTGLLNRVGLERVAAELRTRVGHEVTVLFVDLDHFKAINDSLGHSAGDEVLRVISDRLTTSVRLSDVVCRIGGDEFFLLLDDGLGGATADALAESLLAAISTPIAVEGTSVTITASIGLVRSRAEDFDLEGAYTRTDTAMYTAKWSGRGRIAYA